MTLLLCMLALTDAASAEEPTHRAVLAGVWSYSYSHPRFGWASLHTERDLALMRTALEARGFDPEHIHDVGDAEATREGILGAIDTHLVDAARPGDHVLFFWSGHGQQIADDDDDDEIDRFDEALVAWNAPRTADSGYDGSAHLRDDELGERVRSMRRAVGPTGSVVVAIDSCHSGTATRAEGIVRGGAAPIGEGTAPSPALRSDFVETDAGSERLAPYVVLSAARAHQLAREVPVGQETHGAFTGALAEALASEAAPSWSGLLDVVRAQVLSQVSDQVPQLEGTRDLAVFGADSVTADPSFSVASLNGDRLVVDGGSLHGLEPASVVEVHPPGSVSADPDRALARGAVESVDLSTAVVQLERVPADAQAVREGRAFVTQHATGDLSLTVGASAAIDDWSESIGRLAQARLVHGEGEGEVRLAVEEDHLVLIHRAEPVLRVPHPVTAEGRTQVLEAVQKLAYTKLVQGVDLADPNYRVRLELRAAQKVAGNCEPTGESFVTEGGELQLPVGSRLQIVLHPEGRRYFYPTVVHTGIDGFSAQLYPRHAAERVSPLEGPWVLPTCPQVTGPPGVEQLTVLSTSGPVDLSPLIGKVPTERMRDGLAPIQVLLDAIGESGAGLAPTRGEQQGASTSIVYTIVPAKSAP